MSAKVGIVRDDRYLLHQPGLVHPDHPDRLRAIYEMLDREFGDTVATITLSWRLWKIWSSSMPPIT